MGDKKPSVRTLDSGEKVTHYPDGRQVLIHSTEHADRVHERQQELEDAHTALNEAHLANIEAKRRSLAAGSPVPHDKRTI
jgi:hypothetical protein